MKLFPLPWLFGLLPCILQGQSGDPVLDSLKRPLPANASIRNQAERLESILHYTLDDQFDLPYYSHCLDSLFRCCISGKTGDPAFEHKIEGEIPMFQGLALLYKVPEKAKVLFESSLYKFAAYGDSAGMSLSYMYLGSAASAMGDSLGFATAYTKSLALSSHIENPYVLATAYNNLGVSCYDFGRFAEAAALNFRVLDLIDKYPRQDLLQGKSGVLTNIGAIYTRLGDNRNARMFSEKALEVAKMQHQDLSEIYSQLAWTMIVDKEYRKALEVFETLDKTSSQLQSLNMVAAATYSKALCYRKLGDVQKALPLAREGVQALTIEKHASFGSAALLELANCEFEAKLIGSALQHALLAFQTFVKAKNNGGCVESAELLTTIYKHKGNYRKALEYNELRYRFQQQIERQQSTRQLAFGEFTRNAEAEKAQRETEVKAQLDRQRNIRFALYAGLVVLTLLAFLLYNRFRLKQKTAQQLEAKNREVEAARRRAEQERARAEASEAFKSRFLANMSHEIRTPLHGIAGFTDLLLDTSLSEKQRRWLSSIQHSTDRLGEVVNDILDLSKLEAGELKLRSVPFSPARVAADVLDALALRAQNKGVSLRLELNDDVPEAVLGDPTRLYQVLMNLVGNAVKFTEQGGVTLSIDRVTWSHPVNRQGHTSLQFSVQDTGIGIPPERLAAVFESFQQAGEDTTARFGGTGLGLTIARELVQLYGSDIRVESELGKGSTFSFALDLHFADAAALERSGAAGDQLYFSRPLRVLLVDDNAFNREIAGEAILRHFEQAQITEAPNGKQAVEQLEQQPFDIVLMDMQMPEMSGTEATRYIREQLLSEIPIIALTASATPEEIEAALGAGMDRHLAKPFKPLELAHAVADVLGWAADSPTTEKSQGPAAPAAVPKASGAFDLRFLRDFCDGDEAQVQQFLQRFREQCPLEIEKLENALQEEDREAIYRAAHSFKPQLEFVGLKSAASIAMAMEQGTRSGLTFQELSSLFANMKEILSLLPDRTQ